MPHNLQHALSSFQVLRFALSSGFQIWNRANFSLKPAPRATLDAKPQLGSSAWSLGNEVWERNHRHPSGLATVSDRSWAKSSVYTGDYPGGLRGAPGAGAGQGTLLPVRPRGRAQSPGLVGSDPEGDAEQGFTQSQSASEKLHMTINWPAGPARRPNYSPTEPANKSWRALAQGWSALYWLERVHIERAKERGLGLEILPRDKALSLSLEGPHGTYFRWA